MHAPSDLIDLDPDRLADIARRCLSRAHEGELFMEARETESLVLEDGRLKSAAVKADHGFGLRAVVGETTVFSASSELSERALVAAADHLRETGDAHPTAAPLLPPRLNHLCYGPEDPVNAPGFSAKVDLLAAIDLYARRDPQVREMTVKIDSLRQIVEIVGAEGIMRRDVRPLVKVEISIVLGGGARRQTASFGFGGRQAFDAVATEAAWKAAVNEAIRQARVAQEAQPAPAGEMDVVLGPGWPGVLIHEAVGHNLEGDVNRQRIGAFSDLLGRAAAAKGVTVIDDGTIEGQRGSLNFDDEGTPTGATILIEDGILVNFMQDRKNARLMGMRPTGNGRRQSYAHRPMPRMTNIFLAGGPYDAQEIIASVRNGLYAASFGGGQVDVTSGQFVFSCTGSLSHRERPAGSPGPRREHGRKRAESHPGHRHGRQRPEARSGHRQLREIRPTRHRLASRRFSSEG